jgi:large subunit ribosomal protein L13
VIVVNAKEVKLTGKKEEQKEYQRYSGFRGGLKQFTAAEMRASHPERMIMEAVWGMLPKNNIARKMMTRVKVFAGPEHTHAAQKPVEIKM